MPVNITMPALSPTMEEGTLAKCGELEIPEFSGAYVFVPDTIEEEVGDLGAVFRHGDPHDVIELAVARPAK